MRIGPHCYRALPTLLLAAALAGPGASACRAQAVGSLSEPMFQRQLDQQNLQTLTPRLDAMGGVYIAVDDPNNLINLWQLDRNPAALIEDVQGSRVEVMGFRLRPATSYGPSDSDAGRYDSGFNLERFLAGVGRARWRNKVAVQGEGGYRSYEDDEEVSQGVQSRREGAGPRLGLTLNERIGRFYYGMSLTAYNVDESTQMLYDTNYVGGAGIDRILNSPTLNTDRVAYHSVLESGGLQYELMDGLRFGVTFGLEQQRIDGATSNERMQLDALNNRNLIRESVGAIYRYRDKVVLAARFFHNSYDATETFVFSRRKKLAVADPPVVYNGTVASHLYRDRSFDSRGTWRIDPKHLQVGFAYSAGKEEVRRTAAVGPGSYNFLDSLYLLSTLSGDTVGVSGGALITDARQIDNYVRWGLGAQYHPTARSTLAADYSRFTSERLVDGVMWAPDYRTLRVGGEYQLSERVAVRAGYARLSQDEDRNKLIDKREGHEITLGLGYTRDGRKSMELVYLTGNFTSDFADPSHLEVQERGLHLYGRLSF